MKLLKTLLILVSCISAGAVGYFTYLIIVFDASAKKVRINPNMREQKYALDNSIEAYSDSLIAYAIILAISILSITLIYFVDYKSKKLHN